MYHIFKKGQADQPIFVLLHGTGGDEHSLLGIANFLNPHASYLSLRGQVSENGALRFFKRLAEGQYDEEDIAEKTIETAAFIKEAAQAYGFDLDKVILVGFSNGSNIGISLMLADQSPFKKGILMAPMYPIDTHQLKESKAQSSVFLSMGRQDPIVPLYQSYKVISEFESRGAQVESYWVTSHQVTESSLEAAKDWLEKIE